MATGVGSGLRRGVLVLAAVGTLGVAGPQTQVCDVAATRGWACILTGVTSPGVSGPAARGRREGRACAYNILRLIAWGDVRVETARRNGSIREISSIDFEVFQAISTWGIFTGFCTLVTGN